jgi:DNA-binding response OmpR family regulator
MERGPWLKAREFAPDIIFLDVVMPEIDGGDVAQQIRSDPMLAHVPIVFLTAIVSAKEGGHEIGGFPFLAKPVSLDAVIEASNASAELREQIRIRDSPKDKVDTAKLNVLGGLFLREGALIDRFIHSSNYYSECRYWGSCSRRLP